MQTPLMQSSERGTEVFVHKKPKKLNAFVIRNDCNGVNSCGVNRIKLFHVVCLTSTIGILVGTILIFDETA